MSDLAAFLYYLIAIQVLGLSVWPLTRRLFHSFPDQGWGMSKALGLLLLTWVPWILSSLKWLPFSQPVLIVLLVTVFATFWIVPFLLRRLKLQAPNLKFQTNSKHQISSSKHFINWKLILFEELLFIGAFGFWTIIRAYNPDIHNLEKFMDYGFVLSILRGEYFPPLDHFLAGETINYYYFGHVIMAVLTRLSTVPPNIAYNLQIALLFGLTVLGAFCLGFTLSYWREGKEGRRLISPLLTGLFASLFVAFIGNLHAISNLRSLTTYWYPTATRLIPNTINEFPLYSFVVADLHGHVSDLPIVLLAIGLLISYAFASVNSLSKTQISKVESQNLIQKSKLDYASHITRYAPLALAIGATYATNSWDFPFFLALAGLIFWFLNRREQKQVSWLHKRVLWPTALQSFILLVLSVLFYLPYWLTVQPLSKGIGLVAFVGSFNPKDWQELANLPLPFYLFKRFIIRSPLDLMFLLWGFYTLLALLFLVWYFRKPIQSWLHQNIKKESIVKLIANFLGVKIQVNAKKAAPSFSPFPHFINLPLPDVITLIMIGLSFILILTPEYIYISDIYKPDYYRANTLFKFYYAAWVLMGIATAYGLWQFLAWLKKQKLTLKVLTIYLTIGALLVSVFLYPYLAINSITGEFKGYKGLNGTAWAEKELPSDTNAIDWINQNIEGQPIFVEAVGESYTNASRISALTGVPVVLGWPVHEWLWRGSYSDPIQPESQAQKRMKAQGIETIDSVGNRVSDVKEFYETDNLEKARDFLEKYQVEYVYVGEMEREKYPGLREEKFIQLGEVVFEDGETRIYRAF